MRVGLVLGAGGVTGLAYHAVAAAAYRYFLLPEATIGRTPATPAPAAAETIERA